MEGIIGEIRAFAGNFAPVNWLICNGNQVPISTYDALFSLIGTTYGGDGVNNFKLPDLRGRLAIGQGQGVDKDKGKPLTNRAIGSSGGSEYVTLTEATMPAHNHFAIASTAATGSVSNPTQLTYLGPTYTSAGVSVGYIPPTATGFVKKAMDETTITSTGQNQPHNNVMPVLAINYIICYYGIYPSSS